MEIVNVEYHEIEELDEKSTEELTEKANTLYQQMQLIGAMGIQVAAQAGQCLTVIKERVGHGNWGDWCKQNLQFSERKAQNMMKLSAEMHGKTAFFANPQTFADIGISKVYELLSAPEEVQKAMIENPEAEEMNVREFKDEIRRLKEELAEERAKEKINESEEELTQAKKRIEELTKELNLHSSEKSEAEWQKELDSLKSEIEKETKKAAKAAEKLKAAQAEMERKAEAAAEEAVEKAKKEAAEKFKEENKLLIDSNRQAAEEIDRLQKRLENNTQPEIAGFKIHADQLQQSFNACMESAKRIESSDAEQAQKMRTALK
ncbi:MAG: DUF3102 domain-containing protein, partial [Firmicutes bacterium]|nr:DUF3102 domain-containing protein [Bacillota bacterium]